MVRALRTFAVLLAVAAAAGCTVKETNPPALAGPSELGLSLALQATPDVLTQDGSAQAQVVVTARDPNGQPVRNLGVRVEITQGGRIADYGTLSPGKNVSTGSDGRAILTYTAPPAPLQSVDTGADIITLAVTPSGSDYAQAVTRTVNIRLVPPGVIIPPSNITAGFTSPATAAELENVVFNASPCGDGDAKDCTRGSIAGYAWDFGDGTTGTGMTTTHQYHRSGTYLVTLTVSDALGRAVSTSKSCVITSLGAPKADFTFSPASPAVLQLVQLNAATSTAAEGRVIDWYVWDFGDGTRETHFQQATADHDWVTAGAYSVSLTVTDSGGRTNTTTKTITIGGGAAVPTASFTFTALPGGTVSFTSTSTAVAPATIASVLWDSGTARRRRLRRSSTPSAELVRGG